MYKFKCQICDQVTEFVHLDSLLSGMFHILDNSVQVEMSYTCCKCGTVHEGSGTIELKVSKERR